MHFISDDWELRNFPVGFRKIEGPHTAEAVGIFVGDILKPYVGNISRTIISSLFFFLILKAKAVPLLQVSWMVVISHL